MYEQRMLLDVTTLISRGISPKYSDEGYIVINQRCIRDNRIDFDTSRITDRGTRINLDKFVQKFDVLINSTGVGTLGRVAQVKEDIQDATVDSHVTITRPNLELVDGLYFGYSVIYRENIIESLGAGATGQTELSRQRVGEVEILLPPLHVQRKIAAILSAYDDLIENNTRRIQILEEMAQAIYREWFIHFRFPGHEGVRMVDSGTELGEVPDGWEVREMQEVSHVIDCLHSKKPSQTEDGYGMLLQLFNIGINGKLDTTKKFLISEEDYLQWTSRIEVLEGDCVITNVGRIAAVAQIPKGVKAALGRNMTGVRPILIPPTYLIEYLLSPHMESEVRRKRDSGTIMDSLNVRGIIKLCVPVPPTKLLDMFENIARPIRRRIEILADQNSVLRATRDLLLPRLVSGEVDVSEVEVTGAAIDE